MGVDNQSSHHGKGLIQSDADIIERANPLIAAIINALAEQGAEKDHGITAFLKVGGKSP
jgi:hypothetical protein